MPASLFPRARMQAATREESSARAGELTRETETMQNRKPPNDRRIRAIKRARAVAKERSDE